VELAVKSVKEGAADFVVKPWDNDKLVASVQNAYNLRKTRKEMRQLKEIKRELVDGGQRMFWGQSAVMKKLEDAVNKVAGTDATILITGQNGTGKELLAMEIHRRSLRSQEIMVPVDMGAITETLFESELFGHVKGAFTDAKADRAGKFEVAHKGTLFLDEIGNLPLHLQSKLLTVLQTYQVVRVGGNMPVRTDFRLVCATNRDLNEMVRQGTFREDLLYRINTIHLELPPLCERKEDIVPLAERFLEKYAARYHKVNMHLSPAAVSRLKEYSWPGNIRELQHTIEKAVIMAESDEPDMPVLGAGNARPVPSSTQQTLEQMECELIRQALEIHRGNMSAVAVQLGITRQTLYNKLRKYGL
jgi:DNA-binding NtrC family response regulator